MLITEEKIDADVLEKWKQAERDIRQPFTFVKQEAPIKAYLLSFNKDGTINAHVENGMTTINEDAKPTDVIFSFSSKEQAKKFGELIEYNEDGKPSISHLELVIHGDIERDIHSLRIRDKRIHGEKDFLHEIHNHASKVLKQIGEMHKKYREDKGNEHHDSTSKS